MLAASCSEPLVKNDQVPPTSTRPPNLLTAEQRVASPITREWLVGYWAFGGCQTDYETALWPDGTYTMSGGHGRWTLSGSTLTITREKGPDFELMQVRLGDAGSSTLRKIGPDEMQVDWAGGQGAGGLGGRFFRCS
jgi:hypothetical protein